MQRGSEAHRPLRAVSCVWRTPPHARVRRASGLLSRASRAGRARDVATRGDGPCPAEDLAAQGLGVAELY